MSTHHTSKVRVLLADDHLMVRDGLKRLVNDQPDMKVIAEASDGREALELAQLHLPDIALLDMSMPGWDGVTAAREISDTCPHVRIIAVTRHDNEGSVQRMLDAGACGYVLKQSPSSELVRAVRTVAGGHQYVDPAIKRPPAAAHQSDEATEPVREGEPLTAAEENVLRLIGASWTSQRIAERLRLDSEAVAALKGTAMRKAGLLTRLQVIAFARSHGWRQVK